MTESDNMLLEAFHRLLASESDIATVRAIQHGGSVEKLWSAIVDSGFLDALVPEAAGGVGLGRRDMLPLLLAAGEHLLPVAFGHTLVARLIAAEAGSSLPEDGAILLWPESADGRLRSQFAPAAHEGRYALVQNGTLFSLWPLETTSSPDGFGYSEAVRSRDGQPLISFELDGVCLLDWAAALTAISMAGAISRVLAMCVQHVTDRKQFGRSLGNFQAIQQMMAQAAEQTMLAMAAARVGFAGEGAALSTLRVAVAKGQISMASIEISRIAHAVHGAIGVSEEFDLQLYVRQLKKWQLSYGSDAYWNQRLGEARIDAPQGTSVDFIRAHLAPAAA